MYAPGRPAPVAEKVVEAELSGASIRTFIKFVSDEVRRNVFVATGLTIPLASLATADR